MVPTYLGSSYSRTVNLSVRDTRRTTRFDRRVAAVIRTGAQSSGSLLWTRAIHGRTGACLSQSGEEVAQTSLGYRWRRECMRAFCCFTRESLRWPRCRRQSRIGCVASARSPSAAGARSHGVAADRCCRCNGRRLGDSPGLALRVTSQRRASASHVTSLSAMHSGITVARPQLLLPDSSTSHSEPSGARVVRFTRRCSRDCSQLQGGTRSWRSCCKGRSPARRSLHFGWCLCVRSALLLRYSLPRF